MNPSRIARLLCLLIGLTLLPKPCSAQTYSTTVPAQILMYRYTSLVDYLSISSDASGVIDSWYWKEDIDWNRGTNSHWNVFESIGFGGTNIYPTNFLYETWNDATGSGARTSFWNPDPEGYGTEFLELTGVPSPPMNWTWKYEHADYGRTNASEYPEPGNWVTNTLTHVVNIDTTIKLHTGVSDNNVLYGRTNKFTLITILAYGNGGAIEFTNITAREPVNADNQVFFTGDPPNSVIDVTPGLPATYSNYTFHAGAGGHKIVKLSRLYHPYFDDCFLTNGTLTNGVTAYPHLWDLQDKFDEGSRILAKDDDAWPSGWIKDTNSLVVAGSSSFSTNVYQNDDVPFPVEFEISNAAGVSANNVWYYDTFPAEFSDDDYFDVAHMYNRFELDALAGNIKQVNSCPYSIEFYQKWSWGEADAIPGRSMVIRADAPGIVYIHEWGHMCGIHHRGEPTNPGNTNYAIMHENTIAVTNSVGTISYDNKMINRYERQLMRAWVDKP